jgi:hypothetical protein
MIMAQASTSTKSKTNVAAVAVVADQLGAPGFDRRLSDKILAAFNHAYASGAIKAANRLKAVLADVDTVERAAHERRQSSAIARADLWVAFVEARNRYNTLSGVKDVKTSEMEAALEQMKDAYRLWSASC